MPIKTLPSFEQLTLDLFIKNPATLENFYPSANQEIVNILQKQNTSTTNQHIYLWGESGVGRSHLAIGSCRHLNDRGLPTFYLALKEQPNLSPKILENCENMFLLCIDDIDAVANNRDWEEAIFHCFNRLVASGGNFLVTAKTPPTTINFALPDLQSRLSSLLTFHLKPLNDEQKIELLQLYAKRQGLKLDVNVAKFILNNYNRSLPSLLSNLETLNVAALRTKRSLTVPFVKEVLAL